MSRVGRAARRNGTIAVLILCLCAAGGTRAQGDAAELIRRINAVVQTRYEHVLGFTDVEHYAVFRGKNPAQPAATMTVKVTYQKGKGKSYVILSQTGSHVVQKFGLRPLLENEERINNPATFEQSWFISANYGMKPRPEDARKINGRECIPVAIKPKRKAPNMIDGTLWVGARGGSIVRVEGIASQSPSVFAGTTKMMRDYAEVDGYAMATHARAESNSMIFGRTVVTIDYGDYHLQTR